MIKLTKNRLKQITNALVCTWPPVGAISVKAQPSSLLSPLCILHWKELDHGSSSSSKSCSSDFLLSPSLPSFPIILFHQPLSCFQDFSVRITCTRIACTYEQNSSFKDYDQNFPLKEHSSWSSSVKDCHFPQQRGLYILNCTR